MLSIKQVLREQTNANAITLVLGDGNGPKGGNGVGNLELTEPMLQTLLRKSRERPKRKSRDGR